MDLPFQCIVAYKSSFELIVQGLQGQTNKRDKRVHSFSCYKSFQPTLNVKALRNEALRRVGFIKAITCYDVIKSL